MYYNRARYYNPETWRFISRDPIDIVDDINLYAYVGNNPIGFVDLMGTEKVLIMYSPKHFYNILFSIEEVAKNEKERLINLWYKEKNINLILLKDWNDFIKRINDFWELNSNWEIIYIWHNSTWLSKEITDKNIDNLDNMSNNNTLELIACKTINTEWWKITKSNQIAKKLSNQLNINVFWPTDNVRITSWNYTITEWTWKEITPN